MSGGQLALAFVAGGLGFALADFADRYLATYDPSATGTAPTDRFTGGTNGTLANTLNIASAPSIMRIGVGVGITALPLIGAFVVKNPFGKAALHGLAIGAGIKLFSTLWNAYVMANLLKPADTSQKTMQSSLGARLYPAEVVAAQNIAAQTQTNPQGLNAPPAGQQRNGQPAGQLAAPPAKFQDPGPFAGAAPVQQQQQAAKPNGNGQLAAPPPASGPRIADGRYSMFLRDDADWRAA